MDFELTEDQRAFADTARQFAQAELAPHAAHWDAEAIFPREAIAKAGELGFCGLYAPESAGGLALPRLDATLVFEEMAAVDPSTTAFITIHNMATWMLGTWATPEVREHWGELLTSGQKLASYCLTEPGAARTPPAQDARRAGGQPIRHQRQQGLHQRRGQHRRAGAHGAHGRCRLRRQRHQRLRRAGQHAGHQLRQEGRKNGLEQPAHAPDQL
jgi:hypothetical protein